MKICKKYGSIGISKKTLVTISYDIQLDDRTIKFSFEAVMFCVCRHSHGHSADQDLYTHFSTFALSGQDGTTRWQHLPGDFDVSTKQQNQVKHIAI